MRCKQIIAAAMVAAAVSTPALSAEYVMSASADYSGPFADVMPSAMSGINAVAAWWNKDVGSKLGVKVDVKIYDMRYDTTPPSSRAPGRASCRATSRSCIWASARPISPR